MNQRNCFTDFIYETHQLNLSAAAEEHFLKQQEDQARPVTVRLHPDILTTVDNISDYLGMSRQKFLSEAIDGAVSLAIDAIATSDAHSRTEFQGLDDTEKQKFVEAVRTQIIKELVK